MHLATTLVSFALSALVGGAAGGVAVGLIIRRGLQAESSRRREALARAFFLELRMNAASVKSAARAEHRTGPDFAYPLNLLSRSVWNRHMPLLAQLLDPDDLQVVLAPYRRLEDIERLVARGRYLAPETLAHDLQLSASQLEKAQRHIRERLLKLTGDRWFATFAQPADRPNED